MPVADEMLVRIRMAYNRGAIAASAELERLGVPHAIAWAVIELEELAPVIESLVAAIDHACDSLEESLDDACRQRVADRRRHRVCKPARPHVILSRKLGGDGSKPLQLNGTDCERRSPKPFSRPVWRVTPVDCGARDGAWSTSSDVDRTAGPIAPGGLSSACRPQERERMCLN